MAAGSASSFFLLSLLLVAAASAAAREFAQLSSSCSETFLEDHHHVRRNSSGLHLTLHHIRGECSPVTLPPASSFDILQHDDTRVQRLLSRLSPAARPHRSGDLLSGSSVSTPLNPGTSLGVGNYVTRISLGTPPKDYVMVVDTGSSLTWLQCQPCRVSCYPQQGPVFDPKASSTYSPVPCTAPECAALRAATLNPSACSQAKVCIYEASYGDSSFSVGYLGRDTLTVGASPLPGFIHGCGQDNEGLFGRTAGLIGLAKDRLSMLSQLAPKYGNSFSYCLPTTASAGYLSIGSSGGGAGYAYTPMVAGSDKSLYFIKLVGILVAGKPIAVPATAYTGTPTIIDSGTVITRIPPSVLTALSQAVVGALKGHATAPGYSILETCFKGTSKGLPVPPVSLLFDGGAELKLSPHNVFYDLSSGTQTCLAFASSGGTAIIGNRQQQTFSVVYDIGASKIGFAAGGCS